MLQALPSSHFPWLAWARALTPSLPVRRRLPLSTSWVRASDCAVPQHRCAYELCSYPVTGLITTVVCDIFTFTLHRDDKADYSPEARENNYCCEMQISVYTWSTCLMRDVKFCRVSAFAKYIFDEKIFHGPKPHLLLTGSKLNESLLKQCQLCYGRGALLGELAHSVKIRDEHGLWRRECNGWLSCLEAEFVDHVRQVAAVCTSSRRTVQPAGNGWDFAETLPREGKVMSPVGPYLLCKFQRLPWSCFPLISYFMFLKFPQGGKQSSVVNKINVLTKAHGGGVCNWTSCLPSQCTGPSLLTFIPLLLSCKDLLESVCYLEYLVNITCSFLPVPFSHCSSCLEHSWWFLLRGTDIVRAMEHILRAGDGHKTSRMMWIRHHSP